MSEAELGVIETKIPARLDRLPWAKFHWRIIIGLGTAWVLDGLEVTIVGSVASRMTKPGSGIAISSAGIGIAAAIYVAGACVGALIFGHLTDRLGRRRLFMVTLALYMVATALTAVSFSAWFFFVFRFLTGAGIGGEYAAVNSAIDELIPARARGRVDLVINGSYWLGSIAGSALAIVFLNKSIFATDIGWRLTFGIGIVLAVVVLLVRRHVPESPRWLFIHGHEEEAEALVRAIEGDVRDETGERLSPVTKTLEVRQRASIGFSEIARTAFSTYPRRSLLCLALFVGQAFIYNGITFNLGTLMSTFFHVASGVVPVFLILYAAANFLGPLLLGRLFDTVGRVTMITTTYLGSALLGLALAGLFAFGVLSDRWSFIAVVMVTFFLASAGASAAYLTASEIFPMETRALSIAFFYSIGTAVGGITGPLLFGPLISTGVKANVAIGFLIGSALMIVGGVSELFFGVHAEQAQLEDIATPLTAENQGDDESRGGFGDGAVHEAIVRQRLSALDAKARAAELRAEAHELRAAWLSGNATGKAQAVDRERAAEIARLHAMAADEQVAELQARAAGSSNDEAAAHYRAMAHLKDAEAIASTDETERARHRVAGAAALERAREAEQRQLADEARAAKSNAVGDGADANEDDPTGSLDEVNGAIEMHERWAIAHATKASALERGALGGTDEDSTETRIATEQAQAATDRLEAATRWTEAARLRAEFEQRIDVENGAQQAQVEEMAARARIQQRQARRRAEGPRRFLPGPGRLAAPPLAPQPAPPPEEALDREIIAIERALEEHGPLEEQELARLVGSRYWGPGVFRDALRQAVSEGGARRLSRGVYDSVHQGESAPAQAIEDRFGRENSSHDGQNGEGPGSTALPN